MLNIDDFAARFGADKASLPRQCFIDFLLTKKPKLCVSVEPIYEWCDFGSVVLEGYSQNIWRPI